MRRRGAIAFMAAVVSLLASCQQTPPGEDFTTIAEVAWESPATVVSGVEVADGVAVATIWHEERLVVAGWDVHDGARLWERYVVRGGTAAGASLTPPVVSVEGNAYTAVLSVGRTPEEQLLSVINLATGDEVGLSDSTVFTMTPLIRCADAAAFCFLGRYGEGSGPVWVRVDPVSGVVSTAYPFALPEDIPSAYFLQEGFVTMVDSEGNESLGRMAPDGSLQWRRNTVDVFGDGASDSSGATWHIGEEVMVGVRYGRLDNLEELEANLDAGDIVTTAIEPAELRALDMESGESLWTFPDTRPCAFYNYALVATARGEVLACRVESATMELWEEDGETQVEIPDAETEVVAVRASDGAEIWSAPVGAGALRATDDVRFLSAARMITVDTGEGVRVIDTGHGDLLDIPGDAIFACAEPRSEISLLSARAEEPESVAVGDNAVPCTSSGDTVDQFSTGAVLQAGVEAGGGLWIVATERGLTGYIVPGSAAPGRGYRQDSPKA